MCHHNSVGFWFGVGNMKRALLTTATKRQAAFWEGEANRAARKLKSAILHVNRATMPPPEAASAPQQSVVGRRKVRGATRSTPFENFVTDTLGARDSAINASLFVQACLLRWQFMSKEERARYR